jgi:hypothetical protein
MKIIIDKLKRNFTLTLTFKELAFYFIIIFVGLLILSLE